MTVTLTIGIPTFNGEKYIGQAIESIVSQLASCERKSEIEILFSDNGSTDATEEIIADWIRRHPTLIFSYFRNEQNLGFDQNVDLLFKRARGKYVWMFADDDVQNSGSIDRVLRCIDQNPGVEVFLSNFDFYDEQMETKAAEFILNGRKDIQCSEAGQFIEKSRGRYASVSSLIFLTQSWKQTTISDAAGANFIHVQKLFHLLPSIRSYIIASPLFKARYGSENFEKSGDDMITIPLEFLKLCFSLRSLPYKRATVNWLIKTQRKYIFSRLRAASSRGFRERGVIFRELLKHNYGYPPFWYKIVHLLR